MMNSEQILQDIRFGVMYAPPGLILQAADNVADTRFIICDILDVNGKVLGKELIPFPYIPAKSGGRLN